jgi:hypothetical protein
VKRPIRAPLAERRSGVDDLPWEVVMHAAAGDRIAIPGRHVGDAGRVGEVREARGPNGTPPFVVRWQDGHEGICFPGPEARVEHLGELDLS